MSQEPRIRLIKNGTVVGSVWEDANGDLVLEEEESGETLRVGSVGVAVDALNADTISANNSSNVTLGSTLDADTNDIQNVGALDSDSVATEVLSGEWDRRISTTTALENLPTDIQAGETVRITKPETPYRPSSWPGGGKFGEIDVPNVSIECESLWAENGEPIIKIADNANIGGFRFGHSEHVENIDVVNYGFDGNAIETDANGDPTDSSNPTYLQDQTVKQLHGLVFEDATDVDAPRAHFQYTSPWREHNTGGSGLSVHYQARDVRVGRLTVDWIGDRGCQFAGKSHHVDYVRSRNGYDRAVSTNLLDFDEQAYTAKEMQIGTVIGQDHAQGSMVGIDGGGATNWTVSESIEVGKIIAKGGHKSGIHIQGSVEDITVGQVISKPTNANLPKPGVRINSPSGTGTPSDISIASVVAEGQQLAGILVDAVSDLWIGSVNASDTGNSGVRFAGGSNIQIDHLSVDNAADYGLECDTGGVSVNGGRLSNCAGAGAHFQDAPNCELRGVSVEGNASNGVSTAGTTTDVALIDCQIRNNDLVGVTSAADGLTVRGGVVENNQQGDSSGAEIFLGGTDQELWGLEIDPTDVALNASGATRPRWNGVIGGGPLGGVDLTTVAPSEDGVKAMSDGTATGFPQFAEARRDTANTQWVRVDGQATI